MPQVPITISKEELKELEKLRAKTGLPGGTAAGPRTPRLQGRAKVRVIA